MKTVRSVLIALLLVALSCSAASSQVSESVREAAQSISQRLQGEVRNATDSEVPDDVMTVSGLALRDTVIQNLTEDFERVIGALREITEEIADLYDRHYNNGCCSLACWEEEGCCDECCESMSCRNDTYNCSGEAPTAYHRACGRGTGCDEDTRLRASAGRDESNSAIHIPVYIYEYGPNVLCFVEWTNSLTGVFMDAQSQMNDFANLTYFGSTTGVYRFYPGFQWSLLRDPARCPFPNPVDTYDARMRPWYENTVPGDKFVVVLLDMSGSMTGFEFLLARVSVTELLDSLTENDYFLILRVHANNSDQWRPLGCFREKTRATPENILAMKELVMNTNDTRNTANFEPAIREAFRVLANSSEQHKTIVVFTDGDTGTALPACLIRNLNRALNNEVRIFTFLMGRGSDRANLNSVATENRGGEVHQISEYNDIAGKVRIFVDALRDNTTSSLISWSRYRDALGGLILTGSLPVMVENATDNSSRLIGVMGIDILLTKIGRRIDQLNLGAMGYGFVVDERGQLIYHPQVDASFIQDLAPEDILSLELEKFEHAFAKSDFDEIRDSILRGDMGNRTVTAWLTIEREGLCFAELTYYYAPIDNTPFRVAIVLQSDDIAVLNCSGNISSTCCLGNSTVGCSQYPPTRTEQLAVYSSADGSVAVRSVQSSTGTVGGVVVELETEWLEESVAELSKEWKEVYVVDESGFIVASAVMENRTSIYYSTLSLQLMEELVNDSPYSFSINYITGYELRPCRSEYSCESSRSCESDGSCESDSSCDDPITICLTNVTVFNINTDTVGILEGRTRECGQEDNEFQYVGIPNTTLLLLVTNCTNTSTATAPVSQVYMRPSSKPHSCDMSLDQMMISTSFIQESHECVCSCSYCNATKMEYGNETISCYGHTHESSWVTTVVMFCSVFLAMSTFQGSTLSLLLGYQ